MRKSRILAVLTAVFMVISMLPSVAFATAEAPVGTLDGKLKIKGSVAVGITLSADYTKVKPEGLTDDDVTFSWSRKDGETLTEVGTDKTYKVAQEDLGYPLVLKITGQAEKGYSGELSVTTAQAAATEEEARTLAAELEAKEQAEAGESTEEAGSTSEGEGAENADAGQDAETAGGSENQDAVQNESTEAGSGTEENAEENTEGVQETSGDESAEEQQDTETDQNASTDENGEYNQDSDGVVEIGGNQEESGNDQNADQDVEGGQNTDADQDVEGGQNTDADQNVEGGQNTGADQDVEGGQNTDADQDVEGGQNTDADPNGGAGTGNDQDVIQVDGDQDRNVEDGKNESGKASDSEADDSQKTGNASDGSGTVAEDSITVITDNGEGSLDFGSVKEGYTEPPEFQYVTFKNESTQSLNFRAISPEHFLVQDITEPLNAGESVTVGVQPRENLPAGDYNETITYETEEGAKAAFDVSFTVAKADPEPDPEPEPDPDPEYDISVDNQELDFADLEEGYTEVTETQTFTVYNNSTESVTLVLPESDYFDITPLSGDSNGLQVPADGEAAFSVSPKADPALSAGDYTDDLVVGIEEDESITASVTASVKVNAAANVVVSVKAEPGSLKFKSAEEGYSQSPQAKTVTVTNDGTEPVSLSQPESKSYVIGELSSDYLEAGDTATFTVAPKTGLDAGEYNGNINVRDIDGNIMAKVAVAFTVTTPDPVYNLTVVPDSLDFGGRATGYENIPDAQTVTVTNKGNMTAALDQPSADSFTVGELSSQTLEPGETATFTVQPKAGLAKGEYLEDISIGNDGGMEIYTTAYFSVSESVNKLTGVRKPSDITGLANGTAKTAEALKLPSAVTITTTKGDMSAAVAWDVKGCSYNPDSSEKQAFSVRGNVTLPDGVQNTDNISTVTSVNVTVEARTALEANPARNMITGISSDGKYTTDTKITFTAVGAGMDNSKPGKGDTRYVPQSWKITETRVWDGAPYTATFRVSKPGNYTLTVTFGQQRYDGSNWKNTGVQSNSQVSFTVTQAASVTVTPSASRKPAVLTGDNTPIMTFVIILVLAAVCVGGILVYRKKKK